ncbi:MAG: hypothetical protein EAX89_01470 [Candidatus Lokiarchaeota archaeon]|nr:hypothetical protein [Candidatus Lokiarchaeota archaeon]
MILKLKIKSNHTTNKKQIFVWIQNNKEFKNDIDQLLQFFKDNTKIKTIYKLHKYYKITSRNPAIMLSLLSTIQEIIPEIYFTSDGTIDLE